MADMRDQVFNWDDNGYVDLPDSFTTLEPGTYNARIKTYEKGYYQPKEGAKTPPCPQATVHFEVETDAGATTTITNKYCLYSGYPWGAKLKNLFSALGMVDGNGKVSINFDKIIGLDCRVDVTKDPDSRDASKFYNHIDKVLPPAAPDNYDNF